MHINVRILGKAVRAYWTPALSTPRRWLYGHAFTFGLLLPITAGVQLIRGLDHLLFSGFKRTEVREPVFVIGNPRSGTTYLHRLLCMDDERFTYVKLWHTMFPAITAYRSIERIAAIDAALGGLLGRVVKFVERRAFGGWDDIHAAGFNRAEEEESLFIHSWSTPSMMMFHPFPDQLDELDILDRMPAHERAGAMRAHRTSVQRHLYAEGSGRQFLSKNVFMCGRLHSLLDTYPDAKFIHIVRHPYEAVASTCSMFSLPWQFHSPDIDVKSERTQYWARLAMRQYRYMLEEQGNVAADQIVTIRYDDLIADPRGTLEHCYRKLGMEMSSSFRDRLRFEAARQREYRSQHAYTLEDFGLTRDQVYEELRDVFEAYGFDRDYALDEVRGEAG